MGSWVQAGALAQPGDSWKLSYYILMFRERSTEVYMAIFCLYMHTHRHINIHTLTLYVILSPSSVLSWKVECSTLIIASVHH